MRLQTKISSNIIAFAAIAFLFVLTVEYRSIRGQVISGAHEQLRIGVSEQMHGARICLLRGATISSLVAGDSAVIEYLASRPTVALFQDAQVIDQLERVQGCGEPLTVSLLDVDGVVVAATDPMFVGVSFAFREYFRSAVGGTPASYVAIGTTSGELGYFFSHPVRAVSGAIVGVAVVKLDPREVHRGLTESDVARQGEMLIVDDVGVILFSSRHAWTFRTLGELTTVQRDAIAEQRRFTGAPLTSIGSNALQELVGARLRSARMIVSLSGNGAGVTTYLASAERVTDQPYTLIGLVPIADAVRTALRLFASVAAAQVAGTFVFVAYSLYVVRRILRPIRDIQEGVEAVQRGDYAYDIPVTSHDELGMLARTLNTLTDRLAAATESAEQLVRERTEELERVNRVLVGRELRMAELKRERETLRQRSSTPIPPAAPTGPAAQNEHPGDV